MPIVDLNIVLSHHEHAEKFEYDLGLTFSRSDADVVASPVRGKALLNLDALESASFDDTAYGVLLTKSLFADSTVESYFDRIWTIAQALDAPLRVQLTIEPDAAELHTVQWEQLLHPRLSTPLTLISNVYFSRLINIPDLRFEGLRPQSFRRAIVLVANPRGLDQYMIDGETLAAIDVAAEIERAQKGLGELHHDQLSGEGNATLNRLIDKLRDGYDILYLVCHGAMVDGSPYLWLEDEKGNVARTPGHDLVQRLSELQHRPRLIVLASCQSAGTGETLSNDEGAMSSLGPLLAAMGIPAVLAMQGNVTMATLEAFMPVFFKEVRTNGQLDGAVAVARRAVQQRPDSWMPVLFMRLKSGNIWWYRPGFASPQEDLDKWPDLLSNLRDGNCTPILGSGLTEFLFGSRRELAMRWADKYSFPMERHQREDLAQVAQFLAITQSRGFPRRELLRQLREEVLRRHGHGLSGGELQAQLPELMLRLWHEQKARNPAEPHRILASLPLPIYITTNPDNLLAQALASEGKKPRTGVFWWHEDREPPDSVFKMKRGYVPDPGKPLVYHFFGNLQDDTSLVVTEDNYFDFLIASGRHSTTILPRVRRSLTDASLLFLGFRLDQWEFRVLFRSIMNLTGGGRLDDYAHVAVQIDPAESGLRNNEEVAKFFKKFFQNASVSVFWGSVEDFTQQLRERWLAAYSEDLGE
jgi:hypothetical protein